MLELLSSLDGLGVCLAPCGEATFHGEDLGHVVAQSGDGHWGSNCEAEPGREGKEEQRLSSQNPNLKRPKGSENSGGQKEKRKRRQAVKVEAQRKPEAKAEGKGEPGEASAEIDAGGRRKEIADETCMKLCEWKPKGGNHRFMMVDFKNHVVSTEKSGLFCFIWIGRKSLRFFEGA